MRREEALAEAARLRSLGIIAVAGPLLSEEGRVEWDVFYPDSDPIQD